MFFSFDNNDDSSLNSYNFALLLVGISAVILLIKLAESQNRLDYDSRFARVISGFLRMIANTWHTKGNDIKIKAAGAVLVAGPHQTGFVDANVLASKMEGAPPSFLVTDAYNHIPGVVPFMRLAKAIPVKSDKGSSNDGALEQASRVLNEKGCVAIFPQGNLTKIGQETRIYEGAARLAVKNNAPIHVIRLDGFWSIQNRLLPVFIRNNAYYRVFLSALHMNNVRVTKCDVIDFHLKREDKASDDQKIINEICAQLYAYFRHTNDLKPKQIDVVKREITDKIHLTIWNSKMKQVMLKKELEREKQEEAKLGEPTSLAMRNC